MRLFSNALRVSMLEARLFRRFPKLRWSLLGVVVIPAFYAFIYLESVWDPVSHTGNLPAAIVNLDRGAMANGQAVNLGMDLAQTLKDKQQFGFYEEGDPDAARRAVRQGKSLFALVIPADFSAGAMAAGSPGAGKLVVFASEGNNYAGAGFAKRFAEELGHQVNESLNEKRWEVVLGASSSAADSLQRLHEGVARLREGAAALHSGTGKAEGGSAQLAKGATDLSTGVAQLGDGMKQLGAGARTLDAKKPEPADLQTLKSGAAQLASGHGELKQALPQLEDGAQRLADGAGQLRDESKSILFVGDKVSGAAAQLADGATQLRGGLQQAGQGEAKLAEGAQALSQGVAQMADGFAAYSAGASTLAAKVPADAKVDQLVDGSKALAGAASELRTGLLKVKDGSSQLVLGLDTLEAALPTVGPGMEGTASGLAISVQPQIEIDAPVKNNGMGLAPNFIPIALWLGAVMTAFIFHLRRLPEEAAGYSRVSLLLGKLGVEREPGADGLRAAHGLVHAGHTGRQHPGPGAFHGGHVADLHARHPGAGACLWRRGQGHSADPHGAAAVVRRRRAAGGADQRLLPRHQPLAALHLVHQGRARQRLRRAGRRVGHGAGRAGPVCGRGLRVLAAGGAVEVCAAAGAPARDGHLIAPPPAGPGGVTEGRSSPGGWW
jgi:putative membrane protein